MAETGVGLEVPYVSKPIAYNGPAPMFTTDKQCDTARLKTTEILMGWPVVSITVNKIQKFYEALKSSSTLFSWGCEVSEKLLTTVYDCSGLVRSAAEPVIRLADLVGSDIAEKVQEKLPVVRQSPSEVYDAMKSGVGKVFTPIRSKTECIVTSGERRLRRISRSTVRNYRKVVIALDKWLEERERDLEKSRSKRVKVERAPAGSSLEAKMLAPAAVAFHWATSVAMFSVGAAAWAVSHVPVVGQLVSLSPSPASSRSESPTSENAAKSSSSSYESIPESAAAAEAAMKMRRSMLNLQRQALD